MASRVPNDRRDEVFTLFRERVFEQNDWAPFPHQRAWIAASDGLVLQPVPDPSGQTVRLANGFVDRWAVTPRKEGRARFLSDLGAFKIGKSMSAGMWATGFAVIPDARVSLVGLEYDICAPEFDYICDALLSEKGMNLKYDSLQNRPRDGKMWLDFPNGARYEARSWERKDSLKGKEIDAYIYCEAYQLPGIECFTSFSQNLRARRGYAVFATTPDRPWIQQLHELGHGGDPEWHCTCGVDASINPYTYDAAARVRDEKLMTREKFAIHYGGQLGDYVGRVYGYQRGQNQFNPGTHPELFRGSEGNRDALVVPDGWDIVGSIDTGGYYTGLLVAFNPSGDAFVLDEFPNYSYVAGSLERDESITIPQWARTCDGVRAKLGRGTPTSGGWWADRNSQFKRELSHYGINLLPSSHPLETRTEITREYFQHGKVFLAPWLSVLPFEIENAQWPEEATAAGRFARVKDRDHTLDCLEHVLSRRPRGKIPSTKGKQTWLQNWAALNGAKKTPGGNIHLGNQ